MRKQFFFLAALMISVTAMAQNDLCSGVNDASFKITDVKNASVSLARNADANNVDVKRSFSKKFNDTNTQDAPIIQPVDSIAITMDNGKVNSVNDHTAEGAFQLIGGDMSNTYKMYLTVYSNQIAGNYTNDDIMFSGFSGMAINEIGVPASYVRNFTVTGNADTCSTYVEMICTDSILYKITFTYPGIVIPITPVDTVDVTMDNSAYNFVDDQTATMGMFQLQGADENSEYVLYLAVKSDQLAGTYTSKDVFLDYTAFFNNGGKVVIDEIREFTVTGDATNCNSYIEMVSADSVLYRITYSYIYTPLVPVDTVDIVFNDANRNVVIDNTAMIGFFQMSGYNENYILQMLIFSNQIENVYTGDNVMYAALFETHGTDTTLIQPLEYRNFVITGDAVFLNAHIEIISADAVFYRINFIYPGVVEPKDTVVIALDNSEINQVYDETAINGSFSIIGADQNDEYELSMTILSDQIDGNYTQTNVPVLRLRHMTAKDIDDILFSEIKDFTVVGDSNACSANFEMIGSDSILYQISFTYTKPVTSVVENPEVMFVVYNEGNIIVVKGAEGESMAVYDITGKMIATTKSASNVERVNTEVAGIYIVRVGEKAVKIIVK